MTKNQDQPQYVPFELLEKRLRNLPGFSAPATLKEKLFRSIPENSSSSQARGSGIFVRKTWAGAAAVILVCALALVISYSSSISPNRLIEEANTILTGPNTVDHNNARIVDTNRADLLNR